MNNYHNPKNEEDESIIPKLEETQNNRLKNVVVDDTAKLPSYLDNLPYVEGQWSMTNPTGKKVYSISFLLQLGCEAVCQKKPVLLKKPQFSSLSWPDDKCIFGQENTTRKTATSDTIHKFPSLRKEVQLNQTKNVLVPTATKKSIKSKVVKTNNEEDRKYDRPNAKCNHSQEKTVSKTAKPNTVHTSLSLGENLLKLKEAVKNPLFVSNSVIRYKIHMKCKKILLDYEQRKNLDKIIYSLSEDESSVIHTRHEEFVKSMVLITLDCPITQTAVVGKIFAELLSKKILSMAVINHGFDDVLKYWNDFLMDYPQFFSYIATIFAPLLLSQNVSFGFNNLKDSCTSIRPDNSCKLFTEVLYKINSSKETQNIKEKLGGILWIYNKWTMLENISLDVFVPNNQINKYFKKDQVGVFLLSIAIYDKMKLTDNKLLYNILQSWICTNISVEIIKSSLFVRALTIAIVIVCLKLNHSYEDFFDHVHMKLLTHYIQFKLLPENEIQAREVQCMFGIQIMSAALEHPGGMVLKLFNKLYQDKVISKESFELFIKEYEKIAEK